MLSHQEGKQTEVSHSPSQHWNVHVRFLIIWAQAPSVVDPRPFDATANAVARLMATAITKLAQIRANKS